MSRFATSHNFAVTLTRAIEEHFEGNTSQFSRVAGMSQASVCYYARGGKNGRYPSAEALEKLLQPFRPKVRAELAEAFVLDLLPPSARKLVKIDNTRAPLRTEPKGALLPLETEDAFAYLRQRALESHEARRWVEETAKIMRGK